MAKNVQGVIFLRNGNLFETREAALAVLTGSSSTLLTRLNDGEMALARYGSGNNVKTLAGIMYKSGDNKSITVIDVEGASGDVEALRQEINAKLGTSFISSGNTVEANLTALSGDSSSDTSATTSVEGAKRFAEDLIGTLDGGVTAETGYFVKSVSEVDGKVSGTTEALPSYDDTAVAKKIVIAVDETNGQIAVERGEISSSAETIVLTDNTDGGVNFEVNIDNNTIIQDADTKKLKVADAALVQYEGDTKTIAISPVQDGVRTVSSIITLSSVTPSSEAVREEYALKNASGETIGSTIKIYKDSSLYSAYLGHVDDTITSPTDPTVVSGTGDTALCFIYLKTDGTYELVAVSIEEFIEENEFASGVTWDNIAKKVKGVVDGTSESFLTVGADGFKLAGVQTAIDNAVSGAVETLDANVSGNSTHVTVGVEEVDGVITAVTVSEDNIANADDLAELSGKTITAITSTNGSITASISNEAGNKTADIETDADKIQMSGFTIDNTKVFSGIAESDSIATAFEKADTVVTGINTKVDALGDDFVSGATVNGSGVTVVDHVIPIVISGTTTTGAEAPAITVNTDASGNVGLEIGYIDCGTYDEQQPEP